jgi:hypothetical protein
MRHRLLLLTALLLATAGCDKSKAQTKTATLGETLPDLILPAQASFVERSGSEDALSVTVRTPMQLDVVADYYRTRLTQAPWNLESDTKDNQGAIALHATRQGPPLWVRIWPDTEFNATFVQLTGASVKGLKADGVGQQIAPTGGQPLQ